MMCWRTHIAPQLDFWGMDSECTVFSSMTCMSNINDVWQVIKENTTHLEHISQHDAVGLWNYLQKINPVLLFISCVWINNIVQYNTKNDKNITRNRPTHRSTFSKQHSITSRSPKHVNTNQDQQHCCSRCIDIPPGCYMQVSVKKIWQWHWFRFYIYIFN